MIESLRSQTDSGYLRDAAHAELRREAATSYLLQARAGEAFAAMRTSLERPKLTVTEDKTHPCQVLRSGSTSDLLATFGRCHSRTDGRAYIGALAVEEERPTGGVEHERGQAARMGVADTEEVLGRLNRSKHR